MEVQNFGNRLVELGHRIQEAADRAVSKLEGLAVRVGEALSRIGSAISSLFSPADRPLAARQVEIANPPPLPRSVAVGEKASAHGEPPPLSRQRSVSDTPSQPKPLGTPPSESPPPSSRSGEGEPALSPKTVQGNVPLETVSKSGILSESPPPLASNSLKENIAILASKEIEINGKTVPKMASGETAVTRSGLVPQHVEAFKNVASETNTILMFRPVNPMSTGLLAEGTSAKGLNVHGKSSDWGPMAGYIAFDQNLSKKHSDEGAITKGITDNQHSLDHDGDKIAAMPLNLSRERVSYLLEQGLIRMSDESGNPLPEGKLYPNGITYFVNGAAGKGNANYQFRLVPGEGSLSVEYRSAEGKKPTVGDRVEDWTALRVMSDAKEKKALTADYDVFAMLPKMDSGKLIGKSLPESRLDNLRRRIAEAKTELAKLKSGEGREAKQTELKNLDPVAAAKSYGLK